MFDAGSGTIDVKAKYSEVKSGAINFNAAVSFFEAATTFGAPAFDQNPNDNVFFYTNNIKPRNEQENMDFSVKGDWDVGGASLTAVAAYNDQSNFFLTDGASDAFYLYAFTPSCAESFAARLGDTAAASAVQLWQSPRHDRDDLALRVVVSAALRADDLRWLSVPAA